MMLSKTINIDVLKIDHSTNLFIEDYIFYDSETLQQSLIYYNGDKESEIELCWIEV